MAKRRQRNRRRSLLPRWRRVRRRRRYGRWSLPGLSLSLMRVQMSGCSVGMVASTGGTARAAATHPAAAPAPGRRAVFGRRGLRLHGRHLVDAGASAGTCASGDGKFASQGRRLGERRRRRPGPRAAARRLHGLAAGHRPGGGDGRWAGLRRLPGSRHVDRGPVDRRRRARRQFEADRDRHRDDEGQHACDQHRRGADMAATDGRRRSPARCRPVRRRW